MITGMPGVGKSVPYDDLIGNAYERGHEPPAQPSEIKDEGKLLEHKKRIRIVGIPGQLAGPRLDTMDELIEGSQAITCIVHVVANGFAKTRSAAAEAALIKDAKLDTIARYRQNQLQEEIFDLQTTCQFALRAIRKHQKHVWMLVAATKCDLYSDTLAAAEQYYSPHGSNPFIDELKKFQRLVGQMLFNWDSVPVCAALDDFSWNQAVVPSKLKASQRDKLVIGLLRRIESACASA